MKIILTLVLLFSFTTVSAGEFDPVFGSLEQAKPEIPEVQWSDIKKWKPLGHRWAGAMDEQGTVIAIYDLAYPNLFSQFPFGIIGGRKIRKSEIVSMIWDAKFDPNADKQKMDKAIRELQSSVGPIDEGVLPKNWWTEVPWKVKTMARAGEPSTFKLSDIDFNAIVKDQKEFQQQLAKIEGILNRAEGSGFGTNFLGQFEFEKVGEGTYQILWGSNNRSISQPRKIADLRSTKVEFFKVMELEMAKIILGKILDLVPGTVVNALIDTAFDRFFHFHSLVQSTQHNMFLEYLNSAHDGAGPLSKLDLTVKEKDQAIEALSFAQTSLWMSWKWIWKNPKKEWLDDVQKGLDKAKLNIVWLQDHQLQFAPLNPRFGISRDPGTHERKLLMVAQDKPNVFTGPRTAIHYSKADNAYYQRVALEISTAAVVFGSHFIPLVGGWVKTAFKFFVEKPVDTMKAWEGRLTVHLEDRGEYPFELETLDRQRVNPLYQNRINMNDLMAKRRQMIGL